MQFIQNFIVAAKKIIFVDPHGPSKPTVWLVEENITKKKDCEPGTPAFKVEKWNSLLKVGVPVLYLKSEREGNLKTRTVSDAYLLNGESYPVVDLEHLGSCSLDKVQVDHTVDYRDFLKHGIFNDTRADSSLNRSR